MSNTLIGKLKKDIETGELENLYIMWGDEAYLREHYVNQIKAKLVSGGLESFNYNVIDGKNLDLDKLEQTLDALPMMSERTLTVVNDFDIFKADEGKRNRFIEILCDLPEYCCLIFVYDIIEYKPDKRLKKLWTALSEKACQVEFSRQENRELVRWTKRRFAALDKEIKDGDAELLIFLCGSLMTGLISEIGKIAAYAKGKTVSRDDIETVADPVPDAVVFDMTRAISDQKFDLAIEKLRTLVTMGEEPIGLLALLGRQIRQLYTARLAIESGQGSRMVMSTWNMRSAYPAEQTLKAAQRLDTDWCVKAMRLCAETDLMLKSTSSDRVRTMELLVLKLAQEAGMR